MLLPCIKRIDGNRGNDTRGTDRGAGTGTGGRDQLQEIVDNDNSTDVPSVGLTMEYGLWSAMPPWVLCETCRSEREPALPIFEIPPSVVSHPVLEME